MTVDNCIGARCPDKYSLRLRRVGLERPDYHGTQQSECVSYLAHDGVSLVVELELAIRKS
jgi:hypothetical protein